MQLAKHLVRQIQELPPAPVDRIQLTEDRMRLLKEIGLECNIRIHLTWMDQFVNS